MYKVLVQMDMEYHWVVHTSEQKVDIQTFWSGDCQYNCICTYSDVDNNKHITKLPIRHKWIFWDYN